MVWEQLRTGWSQGLLAVRWAAPADRVDVWLQEWKNFLENWDGTIDGQQVLTPEQVQELKQKAQEMLDLLNRPDDDPVKRAMLAIPAIVPVLLGFGAGFAAAMRFGPCEDCNNAMELVYWICILGVFSAMSSVGTISGAGASVSGFVTAFGAFGIAGAVLGLCVKCWLVFYDFLDCG